MKKFILIFFFFIIFGIVYSQETTQLSYFGKINLDFKSLTKTPDLYNPKTFKLKAEIKKYEPKTKTEYRLDSFPEEISEKVFSVSDFEIPQTIDIEFTGQKLKNVEVFPAPKFIFKEKSNYNIKYCDKIHGLFSNFINCTTQDSDGAIWLGSDEDGICKIDGLNMYVYNTNSGLASNTITYLYNDKQGKLWFATTNGIYYIKGDSIYSPNYEKNKNLYIYNLYIDKNKNIWLCTFNDGAILYKDSKFQFFNTSTGLPENYVSCISEDSNGNYWFGTNSKGFVKYDFKNFYWYSNHNDKVFNTASFFNNGNEIWISEYDNGFLKYRNGKFYRFHYASDKKEEIFQIIKNKNIYWLADYTNGLMKLENNKIKQIGESEGYSKRSAYRIFYDMNSNLWISTISYGIYRYDNNLFEANNSETEFPAVTCQGLKYDKSGNLWFLPNGYYLVKKSRNYCEIYNNEDLVGHVWDAVFTNNNDFWLSIYSKGICNLKNNYFNYYQFDGLNIILDFELVNDSLLYSSSMDNGLIIYDFKNFYEIKTEHGLTNNFIEKLCFTSKNELWITVVNNGINILKGDSIANLTTENGLISNTVNFILEDSQKRIWLGTDAGIQLISKNNSYIINKNNGLNSNKIKSILQYNENTFWVATFDGLNEIKFQNDSIYECQIFDLNYGSFITNFNSTVQKFKNGDIYWGTNTNLIKYNFKNDTINYKSPIFNFKNVIFNDSLIYDNNTIIEIKPSENLKVDFGAIDWGYEQGLKYRYSLSNDFETYNWIELNFENNLYFSNINQGLYYLSIQAIGLNGLSEIQTFKLNFLPKWYQTLMFKLSVILILLLFVGTLIYFRIRSLKINQNILKDLVKKQTEVIENEKIELEQKNYIISEQNKYKDSLIKEIHHRVKNNLQMINSMVDMQKRSTTENFIKQKFDSIFNRINAMGVLHEMLYKSENYNNVNLSEFLLIFSKNLNNFYDNCDIEYLTNTKKLIQSTNNTVAICMLINETVSNSIKYAFSETSEPQIIINLDLCEDNNIELKIKDNGIGFDQKEVEQKNTLGLKLVSIFAKQIGGNLTIANNNGTLIKLIFKNKTINHENTNS